MEVLNTVNMTWETVGQYMDTLDTQLGVNVGNLIGHSAVRYYVMGDECQGRAATPEEIDAMRGIVREGLQDGALGLSVSENRGHYDPQGVHNAPDFSTPTAPPPRPASPRGQCPACRPYPP